MYHFAIVEPFELNWKYAAPRDFHTLEYFVQPGLSVEFLNISNGPKKFSIGAYLADGNHLAKFDNEILPARSAERIEKAFRHDEVSAFFSPEDAKGLAELFAEEKFICREVRINSSEYGQDLFALPADQFGKVMDLFSQWNVQQTADVKSNQEIFEDLRREVEKEVEKRHQAEQRAKVLGIRTKDDIKKMKLKAMIGGGCVLLSGVAGYAAKQLKNKGFAGALGAMALKIVSSLTGVFGIRIMGNAAEAYAEGKV